MSWKKYFKTTPNSNGVLSPINGSNEGAHPNFKFQNYGNLLPEVYMGHPNRLERYNQYEAMDVDSEVNSALDIISEFCTQANEQNNTPFDLFFKEKPTETELNIIKKQLSSWCALNQLDRRMFKLFRNTLKYGDQVFMRDPETFKMFWVDMTNVVKIIVNESDGKRPEQYILRNINPNFENLTVTQVTADNVWHTAAGSAGPGGGAAAYNTPSNAHNNSRFQMGVREVAIEAQHVVHLSMTEGLDSNWPFGQSVLENIFKVYKQKELLEDSIVIYRVQRAPERRVFYIDVGSMPSHMAMAFVERVKNEIHQRRIPTQNGGSNFMDSTYNPLSINEDYFFPQTAEGRGSKVETLPGGQNLGEIDDLKFFTNKLFRGLRIPSSYLPTGAEDSAAIHNDGKVATALIQEHRFNQYCKRLQSMISGVLDTEFKAFMKWRGLNIDNTMFELKMNEPQNFAKYRQVEMDSAKISSFSQLESVPYLSKRFLLKRFLGLTEEEMLENTQLWREENLKAADVGESDTNLRNVGISPAGIENDLTGLTVPEPLAEPAPEAAPEAASAGGADLTAGV